MKNELCGPQGLLQLSCALRSDAPSKSGDEDEDDDYKTKMSDEL